MINYTNKDFASIKQELFNFVKKNYPDVYSDFSDAAVGTMFLEFIAYLGDKLFFNLDRVAQENDIDQAQERASLLRLARKNNLKFFGKRAASTLIDFSVIVPVKGNAPDLNYMPLILRGAQAIGAGQVFETLYDSDFTNPLSALGTPNRFIVPNYNANQVITSYTITKREIAVNGRSKYFSKIISSNDSVPFLKITLPDQDVLEVTDIVTLPGTNYTTRPSLSQLYNPVNRWTKVDSLTDQKAFVVNSSLNSDQRGILRGQFQSVPKRYITQYTDANYLSIIFGGGRTEVTDTLNTYISNSSLLLEQLEKQVNLSAFGQIPDANTTMFIKYRVGGGARTNVGQGVLNALGDVNFIVNGANQTINSQVRSSLSVNNPIPAIGGANEPSIEELRYLIKGNNGAKNRSVTIEDYNAMVAQMPPQFGAPYKYSVKKEDNKIKINILTLNQDGTLKNESSSALKNNLKEFLSSKRMINDYIEINDGKIINIKIVYYILASPNFNKNELASSIINEISTHLNTANRNMGEDLYLSQLNTKVGEIAGVTSIVKYEIFNPVNGVYSLNGIGQALTNQSTRQIDLLDQDAVFVNDEEMLEVKFPNSDIEVKFVS